MLAYLIPGICAAMPHPHPAELKLSQHHLEQQTIEGLHQSVYGDLSTAQISIR